MKILSIYIGSDLEAYVFSKDIILEVSNKDFNNLLKINKRNVNNLKNTIFLTSKISIVLKNSFKLK